jgi:hypothetical protein
MFAVNPELEDEQGRNEMLVIQGVAICFAATVVADGSAGQSRQTGVLKELSRLERVWNESHVRGEAGSLGRLWADDFVATVPGMPTMPKAQLLAVWRSGRIRFKRYETSDLRMKVYGDAAVVSGQLERTRTIGGGDTQDRWLFTKVYIFSQGRWQVVAFHASNAPDRKPS